jgi:putative ABC transport system permease protein
VGFVALVLGGIGVASALHAYIREKISTVAVLRCLGASARQSFAVYLVQGLALGLAGAFAGGALGVAVQRALPAVFRGLLPIDVDFFISWPALLRGTGAGVVICFLFSLLPLLSVRRIPPLAALRSAIAERAAVAPDPWRLAIGAADRRSRRGLSPSGRRAPWLSGSASPGCWGSASLFSRGSGSPLHGLPGASSPRRSRTSCARVSATCTGRTTGPCSSLFPWAWGPSLSSRSSWCGRRSCARSRARIPLGRPNLIFFDIQDDQIGPLEAAAAAEGSPVVERAPIVTMKITSVRGRPVETLLHAKDARIAAWALRREYRSTFRGKALASSEKVVEGRFTGRADPGAGPAPISVEEGLARDMQLHLGDEIDWDVQGLPVRTRVGSIRSVEWRRLEPNFFVVFPEGVLEGAPKTYVAALHASSPEQSGRVQRAVVDQFPNVTAIDLALVVETLDGIFSKVAFAIQFMALFTVATGLIVLAGAVLMGRHQRIRETVLLRTLGATRRQLALIQLVEYAVLGVQAAVVGAILAVAGNELLARYVFHVAASEPFVQFAAAVAIVSALAVATGLVAGRGVRIIPRLKSLGRRPEPRAPFDRPPGAENLPARETMAPRQLVTCP